MLLLLAHHPLWQWYTLQLKQLKDPITTLVEVVMGLLLSVQSLVMDINLFEKDMGWEGGSIGGRLSQ